MLTTATDIERFAKSGKATLTIESGRTGNHFTYMITLAPDGVPPLYFVSALTGPNNETDYRYIGKRKERWLKEDAISLEGAIVAINTRAINPHVERYQELSSLLAEVCAVVPPPIPTLFHKPGCASSRPVPENVAPETELVATYKIGEMGECDCQPMTVDLTDAAKIAAFDRVREVLYRKREAE
jgi:hypothetical protein